MAEDFRANRQTMAVEPTWSNDEDMLKMLQEEEVREEKKAKTTESMTKMKKTENVVIDAKPIFVGSRIGQWEKAIQERNEDVKRSKQLHAVGTGVVAPAPPTPSNIVKHQPQEPPKPFNVTQAPSKVEQSPVVKPPEPVVQSPPTTEVPPERSNPIESKPQTKPPVPLPQKQQPKSQDTLVKVTPANSVPVTTSTPIKQEPVQTVPATPAPLVDDTTPKKALNRWQQAIERQKLQDQMESEKRKQQFREVVTTAARQLHNPTVVTTQTVDRKEESVKPVHPAVVETPATAVHPTVPASPVEVKKPEPVITEPKHEIPEVSNEPIKPTEKPKQQTPVQKSAGKPIEPATEKPAAPAPWAVQGESTIITPSKLKAQLNAQQTTFSSPPAKIVEEKKVIPPFVPQTTPPKVEVKEKHEPVQEVSLPKEKSTPSENKVAPPAVTTAAESASPMKLSDRIKLFQNVVKTASIVENLKPATNQPLQQSPARQAQPQVLSTPNKTPTQHATQSAVPVTQTQSPHQTQPAVEPVPTEVVHKSEPTQPQVIEKPKIVQQPTPIVNKESNTPAIVVIEKPAAVQPANPAGLDKIKGSIDDNRVSASKLASMWESKLSKHNSEVSQTRASWNQFSSKTKESTETVQPSAVSNTVTIEEAQPKHETEEVDDIIKGFMEEDKKKETTSASQAIVEPSPVEVVVEQHQAAEVLAQQAPKPEQPKADQVPKTEEPASQNVQQAPETPAIGERVMEIEADIEYVTSDHHIVHKHKHYDVTMDEQHHPHVVETAESVEVKQQEVAPQPPKAPAENEPETSQHTTAEVIQKPTEEKHPQTDNSVPAQTKEIPNNEESSAKTEEASSDAQVFVVHQAETCVPAPEARPPIISEPQIIPKINAEATHTVDAEVELQPAAQPQTEEKIAEEAHQQAAGEPAPTQEQTQPKVIEVEEKPSQPIDSNESQYQTETVHAQQLPAPTTAPEPTNMVKKFSEMLEQTLGNRLPVATHSYSTPAPTVEKPAELPQLTPCLSQDPSTTLSQKKKKKPLPAFSDL